MIKVEKYIDDEKINFIVVLLAHLKLKIFKILDFENIKYNILLC